MKCDKCQALMVQGVFCHEKGCPNRNAVWGEDLGKFRMLYRCRQCNESYLYEEQAVKCCADNEPEAGPSTFGEAAREDTEEARGRCDTVTLVDGVYSYESRESGELVISAIPPNGGVEPIKVVIPASDVGRLVVAAIDALQKQGARY